MAAKLLSSKRLLIAFLAGGWLLQPACLRRELEVLIAPEANSLLIWDSVLIDLFGPQIIRMFNT